MPTPVEHYERAEELLEAARTAADPLTASRLVNVAQAHASLAGVPWSRDDVDEVALGLDREQVAALVALAEELHRWAHSPAVLPKAGALDPVYEEGNVEGWEGARAVVRGLVDPIAREVLDR